MTIIKGMGTRLTVPDHWEIFEHASHRALAVIEETRTAGDFQANLVLSVDDETTDDVVDDERRLSNELRAYQVINLGPFDFAGIRGLHRLAQYVTPADVPVTMEQWCVDRYSLTATVDTLRYDDYADLFEEVVRTWSLESATSTTDVRGGDED